MFNFKDCSQLHLIQNANYILKKNKSPLFLDPEGICNGLVFLAIEYFLLNKKNEFFENLNQLSHFDDPFFFYLMITRLLILFHPKIYSFDKTQNNAYELLDVDIQCTFRFGMVMSKKIGISFLNA